MRYCYPHEQALGQQALGPGHEQALGFQECFLHIFVRVPRPAHRVDLVACTFFSKSKSMRSGNSSSESMMIMDQQHAMSGGFAGVIEMPLRRWPSARHGRPHRRRPPPTCLILRRQHRAADLRPPKLRFHLLRHSAVNQRHAGTAAATAVADDVADPPPAAYSGGVGPPRRRMQGRRRRSHPPQAARAASAEAASARSLRGE